MSLRAQNSFGSKGLPILLSRSNCLVGNRSVQFLILGSIKALKTHVTFFKDILPSPFSCWFSRLPIFLRPFLLPPYFFGPFLPPP